MVCYRLSKHSRLIDLCNLDGRGETWVGDIFNITIKDLSIIFERLLYWDYIRLTPKNLISFAEAIEKGGTERTKFFGFIDGTIQKTCRPSFSVTNQALL